MDSEDVEEVNDQDNSGAGDDVLAEIEEEFDIHVPVIGDIHNIHRIHKMHKNYIYNDILIWTMAMVDIMAMECDPLIKEFDIQWN